MAHSVTPLYARAVDTASWVDVIQARREGAHWNDLRTNAGLSALGRAVVDNDDLIVGQLLTLGAPTQPTQLFNGTWFSPLWASLEREDPRVLNLLLKAGADPNEAHCENPLYRPIHQSSQTRQTSSTLYLCNAGADPDGWPDKNKPMPSDFFKSHPLPLQEWVWHLAQDFDDIQAFMALLKAGANPTLPCPPRDNVWELIHDEWAEILAQKSNHPQVGVALSALEKAMLEWETPTGQGSDGKGSKRL